MSIKVGKALNDDNTGDENLLQNLVETILDTIVDGVVTIDKKGKIHSYNPACELLFGYRAEEVIGNNVSMLMPSPYKEEHDRYISNYLQTNKPKVIGIGREVTGRRKDGTTFPMELAVGSTTGNGDHAFVGIIRDITDRRIAEVEREQLRQSQKMEALGQLTGGIAHDFNNLLAIILGNLDFIADKIDDDHPLHSYLRPSIDAAERGAELTQMLLAFGRKQALRPSMINLNKLIFGFIKLAGRTLGERVRIAVMLSDDLWDCHIDCQQLENALLNLSINARDAMPHGGNIIFETKNVTLDEMYCGMENDAKVGDYVMVSVSDSGVGMTEEVIAKAFEPFFTTKPSCKGTGLGLSMVYGFVKQSQGHIKIYSEAGYGTTIKIYLPRYEDEAGPEAVELREDSEIEKLPNASETTILIVEDNADVLKVTSSIVEQLGYDIIIAETGDHAWDLLQKRDDIDLLLSDVMLPGDLNGPKLAELARELYPNMKVLFNSGYAEHAIFQSGILPENVHLIGKPFRKKQLAEKIVKVLQEDPSDG